MFYSFLGCFSLEFEESRRRFSHQEFASGSCSSVVSGGASSHACSTGSRKTVCSLHPLSPSDVSYLNKIVQHEATEGGTGGGGGEMSSTSSSPRMTPYPSPIPSPKLSSRDNSPSNYNRQQQQRIITHRNSASGSSAPTNIPQQHSSATVLRHSFSFSPSNRQSNNYTYKLKLLIGSLYLFSYKLMH